MKKNVMMRVASIMLVLVLLTSSVISGTFAKYVSEGTGTDSARVAKWGVTIESNGAMFGEHYNGYNDNNISNTYTGSVDSQGKIPAEGGLSKVVAPGTKGNMVAVALKGTPEVAVKVTYSADVTLNGWKIGDTEYCPLYIYVNGVAYNTGDSLAITDLEAAVEAAVAAYSVSYPAGTDLEKVGADALNISWEWPYETYKNGNLCDAQDTALGNATADGYPSTIEISVTTTVTQID